MNNSHGYNSHHFEFQGSLIMWNGEGVYHLGRTVIAGPNNPMRWYKCTEIFDVEAAMRDGREVKYIEEADIVKVRNHS